MYHWPPIPALLRAYCHAVSAVRVALAGCRAGCGRPAGRPPAAGGMQTGAPALAAELLARRREDDRQPARQASPGRRAQPRPVTVRANQRRPWRPSVLVPRLRSLRACTRDFSATRPPRSSTSPKHVREWWAGPRPTIDAWTAIGASRDACG